MGADERRRRVGAEGRAGSGRRAGQVVDVAQRVRAALGRQVDGVGDAPARSGAGMDLDQAAIKLSPAT